MKTLYKSICWLVALGLVLPLSFSVVHAQKGATLLRSLTTLKTVGDIDSLQDGDTFAMACAKCKTIWTSEIKKGVKGAQVLREGGVPRELVGLHLCEGCGSKVEIKGHGKGKKAIIKHVCKACGEHSPFCCVTSRAAENEEKTADK